MTRFVGSLPFVAGSSTNRVGVGSLVRCPVSNNGDNNEHPPARPKAPTNPGPLQRTEISTIEASA